MSGIFITIYRIQSSMRCTYNARDRPQVYLCTQRPIAILPHSLLFSNAPTSPTHDKLSAPNAHARRTLTSFRPQLPHLRYFLAPLGGLTCLSTFDGKLSPRAQMDKSSPKKFEHLSMTSFNKLLC